MVCGSRLALAVGCARGVPAARSEGLGSAVAGTVPRLGAVAGWIVLAGVLGVVQASWWFGLMVACAGLLAALALTVHCVRRLGGITGDVLGAGVELTLVVMLLGGAGMIALLPVSGTGLEPERAPRDHQHDLVAGTRRPPD